MTEQKNALAQIFAACWKDEALKARFMADPKVGLDGRRAGQSDGAGFGPSFAAGSISLLKAGVG